MNKTASTAMVVLACLLVGAVPIVVSFQVSRQQGLQAEEARLKGYATDVLRRSERVGQQIYAGLDRLVESQSGDPCSPSQVRLMGELAMNSPDIQTLGYVAHGRLMCTALGVYDSGGLSFVGDMPVQGNYGASLRTRVLLPMAPGRTFVMVEKKGYVAVVHEAKVIDVTTEPASITLATFSPRSRAYRSVRGLVRQNWIERPASEGSTSFIDGDYLVAIVTSDRYSTKTLAAIPMAEVQMRSRQLAWTLVPFGVAAGIALALLLFFYARRQMGMQAILRTAIRKRELFLMYQPIVDLRTRQTIGAEALIRWKRKDGSMVPPDIFIPVAEECGLIEQVTAQVLQMVTRDARGMFSQYPNFHIGINLSAADLRSEETPHLLRTLLLDTQAGPHNILVEATERGLMDAALVRQVIHDIRALGIEVAVDDFGTGYSSLSYLGTFELDYLKIDKSFVDTLDTGAATSDVALHIIEMAKALKLKMIAEGVETEAQAQLLAARGVQSAQGWLFARPMSMEALKLHLAAPVAAST